MWYQRDKCYVRMNFKWLEGEFIIFEKSGANLILEDLGLICNSWKLWGQTINSKCSFIPYWCMRNFLLCMSSICICWCVWNLFSCVYYHIIVYVYTFCLEFLLPICTAPARFSLMLIIIVYHYYFPHVYFSFIPTVFGSHLLFIIIIVYSCPIYV